MAEITIIQSEPEDGGHCPECERKFIELERRMAAVEAHHPIMDTNTEEAQETAQEALEVAQESLEVAQEAAMVAVVAAIQPEPIREEEPVSGNIEERIAGSETETAGEAEGIRQEEERGEEISEPEPTIIAIEPEPKPAERKPNRFARGRR